MDYNIKSSNLEGVKIIQPKIFEDTRGFFCEMFEKDTFSKLGIDSEFIQVCESLSIYKNTLRGIHFQNAPYSQEKIVRCTQGAVTDVIIDLRRDSKNYKKYITLKLSSENRTMVYIPKGFGHAFLTLENNSIVNYMISGKYSPENSKSIRWNDPEIKINWQVNEPFLSEKDKNAPLLAESDINY